LIKVKGNIKLSSPYFPLVSGSEMKLSLSPIADSDLVFLSALYHTTRKNEMALVPWTEGQKAAFLQTQFQAQHQHYIVKYPNGSFQIIKSDGENIGRLYTCELDGEIRIIDITIMPEYRGKGIGTKILSDILQEATKPVTIYLESLNASQSLFKRLGFEPISDEGIYQLWQRPANSRTNAATV
jgi:N-acetylglutamate synthase-like GNAT family acetyltransferase